MINFFRKIRKKLADDNKPLKYARYAIGEIVLVMIGILLALQVNNWNEDRKSLKFEKRILIDLHNTIIDDYASLERSIRENELSKNSCEIILSHFNDNIPYNDSLAFHFENAHLRWKSSATISAYERAKSYGLDFIKDDSTRILLTKIFVGNNNFSQTLDEREALYFYNSAVPILTSLFKSTEVALSKEFIEGNHIPYDYEILKENKEYRTILKTTVGYRKNTIWWMNYRFRQMKSLEKKLKRTMDKM
jgi:hypothetical protein